MMGKPGPLLGYGRDVCDDGDIAVLARIRGVTERINVQNVSKRCAQVDKKDDYDV